QIMTMILQSECQSLCWSGMSPSTFRFHDWQFQCDGRDFARFPIRKRQCHLGLSVARVVGDSHGAPESLLSVSVPCVPLHPYRLVARLLAGKLDFNVGKDLAGQFAKVAPHRGKCLALVPIDGGADKNAEA